MTAASYLDRILASILRSEQRRERARLNRQEPLPIEAAITSACETPSPSATPPRAGGERSHEQGEG